MTPACFAPLVIIIQDGLWRSGKEGRCMSIEAPHTTLVKEMGYVGADQRLRGIMRQRTPLELLYTKLALQMMMIIIQ